MSPSNNTITRLSGGAPDWLVLSAYNQGAGRRLTRRGAIHPSYSRISGSLGCGDGRSWTKDGTPIELYDRLTIQTEGSNDGLQFEAAWGVDGAHCVSRTRIPELLAPDRLATVCTRPVAVAQCSPEIMQQDSGVLLLNNSHRR
jgi:ADYC domain